MFRPIFLSVFLCICVVFVQCDASAEKKENQTAVVSLTKATFDKFIEDNAFTIVEFFAPWCGHCKRLAPEYEAAAKDLQADGILLASVDATVETELGNRFKIAGYPTLKVFRSGVVDDYKGGRTRDKITQWVRSMTGPAIKYASSVEEARKFAEGTDISFIALLKSNTSESFNIFKSVSDKYRPVAAFIAVVDTTHGDTLHAMRTEEGASHKIPLSSNETVSKFIELERFPLFGGINANNYADYFESEREMVWFVGSDEHYKEMGPVIREVAASYREKSNFVWLDVKEFKEHAETVLGIKSFPGLVYEHQERRYLYPAEQKLDSAESIKQFMQSVIDGKMKHHLFSEPIPETQTEPVVTVVGLTFQEIILDSGKDVFLEVYSPWCGHCKQFEPTYKSFAESVKMHSSVIVANMDGTKNESPSKSFKWEAFPTIFFLRAGTDTPLKYEGPRTVEGLTEFLISHSSKPIEAPQADVTKDEL